MPTVNLTLTDTPDGVSIHHNFAPAAGGKLSPAQAHALDIINRTHKIWGLVPNPARDGIDIDAVHATRNLIRSKSYD